MTHSTILRVVHDIASRIPAADRPDGGGLRVGPLAVPRCHAAENSTIKLALVGCGGRGTGPSPMRR